MPPLKVFFLMVASRVKPFFSRTLWAGVFSGWVSAWMRMMLWLVKRWLTMGVLAVVACCGGGGGGLSSSFMLLVVLVFRGGWGMFRGWGWVGLESGVVPSLFWVLCCFGCWSAWCGVFGGVGCEGEGPESVVVGSWWVVEGYSACLGQCVALGVELVEGVASSGVMLVFLFMWWSWLRGVCPVMVSDLVSGEEESCLVLQLGDYRLELYVVWGEVL